MGLPILGLGVWYALARRERVAGVVISVVGLLWTAAAIYVVVPAAHGSQGASRYYSFYDDIGGSPQGVVRTLLTDPGAVPVRSRTVPIWRT